MFQSRRTYTFYKRDRSTTRRIVVLLRFIVLIVLAYAFITGIVLGSYVVTNQTMSPLLEEEERLFTSTLPYGARLPLTDARLFALSEPQRGDLAIVELPYARERGFGNRLVDFFVRLGTGQTHQRHPIENTGRRVVRRIVGLPGDTVRLDEFVAYVQPRDADSFSSEFQLSPTRYELLRPELPQSWVPDGPLGGTVPAVTLGEEEYFVLADNRSLALDSRHFGPISRGRVLEKVVFRYWPISRFGVPGN